ncbi:TetR/AcrR family transcriptional regulator [Streptomyces sp. NPDC059875]|uniref:TetR/AcrR family transcriptional regulator n=1 Tax=unclassified Streptomyces TaxID=2593676 RepID=UPI003669D127
MVSKRDWLDTGFTVLRQDGARALTIDRLCVDLGLTKGSFYHHFKGMAGFKTDLLQHFEAEHTERLIADAEESGASAETRLRRLLDLVLADSENDGDRLEIAVRAWALQDAEVHALQQRVDHLRIDYLRTLLRDLEERPQADSESDADAHVDAMARMLYLILIGAQQLVPSLPTEHLREVYALALSLLPQHPRRSS